MKERRDYRRVQMYRPGILCRKEDGTESPITVINLSLGGLALLSESQYALGDHVVVRFGVPVAGDARELELRCVVIHSSCLGTVYVSGVKFLPLSADQEARIGTYTEMMTTLRAR